jgi:hypothetical protein
MGRFPGLPDMWEFTEYKNIDRTQFRPRLFDPGAAAISLSVRDFDAFLRACQAAVVGQFDDDGGMSAPRTAPPNDRVEKPVLQRGLSIPAAIRLMPTPAL